MGSLQKKHKVHEGAMGIFHPCHTTARHSLSESLSPGVRAALQRPGEKRCPSSFKAPSFLTLPFVIANKRLSNL